MSGWQPIDSAPETGCKIAIVCDDGMSSSLGLVTDYGILDGEDGEVLAPNYLRGAIWMRLPDDYPLYFMEMSDDY